MQRHIVVVTLPGFNEKHYYIGEGRFPAVGELAETIRRNDGGVRSFVRTITTADEAAFWQECGVRGFNVAPPLKHKVAYDNGRKLRETLDRNETPLMTEGRDDMGTPTDFPEDLRSICRVEGEISEMALKAIKRLNNLIYVRAVPGGFDFSTREPITENHRQAWENIIRGIIFVM